MELLALYIAILALIVAIPGTIDATWNVIAKLRGLKKGVDSTPYKKITSRPDGFEKAVSPRPMPKPDLLHFGGYLLSMTSHEIGHGALACHLKKI